MCGIAGILNLDGQPVSVEGLRMMRDTMIHRGPDDSGEYANGVVALGHRRLSILDLTTAGHQPMSNEDGTLWLVFNGEIYNYKELRTMLQNKGHIFHSQTDAEVILHAYEEYGAQCLKFFNGMWAFALWDERWHQLFCARDRLGVKPFYYHLDSNRFLFASEIKALLQDMRLQRQPNEQVIYDYLSHAYIDHSNETFFKGIKQLPPAHYLIANANSKQFQVCRYWDLEPSNGIGDISDLEAATRFYKLFEDSIRLRLQSDVPVGTCLSGGLDSSSIVCVINRLLNKGDVPNPAVIGKRQKTFSSCFENKRFDERNFIIEVVNQTGVDTHYIFPKGDELFEDIDRFMWCQDEPVNDASQYAQWCVMKLVRDCGVTVVLDGQGGDELLAGYHLFFSSYFEDLARTFQWRRLNKEAKYFSRNHGYRYSGWMVAMDMLKPFVPEAVLGCRRWFLNRGGIDGSLECLNSDFVAVNRHKLDFPNRYQGQLSQHLYRFLVRDRLPSLLRYEDRNSMAFSVEARLPFLDYRLVEFIFGLPNEQKIRDGTTKIVLRNAMENIIPEKVRSRMDKMGFVTPQEVWFRTECASQVNEILKSDSFRQRPYFKPDAVWKYYKAFQKDVIGNSSFLWRCINLELWMRQFIDD